MHTDTHSLTDPAFLQRSADRDEIVELLLDDLTQPCQEYPGNPIDHPDWGAVYTVGAHLAVKHPSVQSFFRQAGEADYNIYRVPYEDLVTVLERYELVLKTSTYPAVDEKLLLYEGFDHQLNDYILPEYAKETAFMTIREIDGKMKVVYISALQDTTVEDQLLDEEGITVTTHPIGYFPSLVSTASTLFTSDSELIPENIEDLSKLVV